MLHVLFPVCQVLKIHSGCLFVCGCVCVFVFFLSFFTFLENMRLNHIVIRIQITTKAFFISFDLQDNFKIILSLPQLCSCSNANSLQSF